MESVVAKVIALLNLRVNPTLTEVAAPPVRFSFVKALCPAQSFGSMFCQVHLVNLSVIAFGNKACVSTTFMVILAVRAFVSDGAPDLVLGAVFVPVSGGCGSP